MPSQRRRRSAVYKFLAITAAAAICGVPWSASALQTGSHARAAAAEAAAAVAPALNKAKRVVNSKIDARLISSSNSARRYARGLGKASAAWAASLLPAQVIPTEPQSAPVSGDLAALPTLDSIFADFIDSRTAIYDINARTVYLPDGRQLEAHSGLGKFRDDIRSVREKNRGVTPPNVYDITLREQPFHGVQALRLTPSSEDSMYGRDGILAHTYMLGPTGQSNGCVVFRDYPVFLQAYLSGQVSRLLVVPGMAAAIPANTRVAGG